MTTWVYLRDPEDAELYTVGFFDPSGAFRVESDHDHPEQAAARVSYLNGGRPNIRATRRED